MKLNRLGIAVFVLEKVDQALAAQMHNWGQVLT